MVTAYIDCVAGASGDMLLGALVDAGLSIDALKNKLASLHLSGFHLETQQVQKNHIHAIQLKVAVTDEKTERHLPEILEIIHNSDLPVEIQIKADRVITLLGEIEARIHAMELNQVHLHELGGIDTIVDIVGFILGLDLLNIEELIVSPLPLGRGFVPSSHGKIPIPAPATLELLKGIPVYGLEIDKELVTPTGAALLTTLASSFGPIPPMQISAVGYGAGSRELSIPNILRVMMGKREIHHPTQAEQLILLETNIDDMNPEIYEHLMDQLFKTGALDVSFIPLHMKKNRPGIMLQVLTHPEISQSLKNIIYDETTTLGIRQHWIERECLQRSVETVESKFGPIKIKIAELGEGRIKYSPEYEDCKTLALKHNLPIQDIMKAAEKAFEEKEKQIK